MNLLNNKAACGALVLGSVLSMAWSSDISFLFPPQNLDQIYTETEKSQTYVCALTEAVEGFFKEKAVVPQVTPRSILGGVSLEEAESHYFATLPQTTGKDDVPQLLKAYKTLLSVPKQVAAQEKKANPSDLLILQKQRLHDINAIDQYIKRLSLTEKGRMGPTQEEAIQALLEKISEAKNRCTYFFTYLERKEKALNHLRQIKAQARSLKEQLQGLYQQDYGYCDPRIEPLIKSKL